MHYAFHSTPTCTFKSRTESISPIIQPSPNPINNPQSPDLLTTVLKNLFLKLQPSHKHHNKEICINPLNQTQGQDPIKLDHTSQYLFVYPGWTEKIDEPKINRLQ